MRVFKETLTAAGVGAEQHIGKENKCLVFVDDISGGTCDLNLELHVVADETESWIQLNNTAASQNADIIDLEEYAGNLPEQALVRINAAGTFTSMSYTMVLGDLLNHGVSD